MKSGPVIPDNHYAAMGAAYEIQAEREAETGGGYTEKTGTLLSEKRSSV